MSHATLFRDKYRPTSIHDIVWPTDHARDTIMQEYVAGRSTTPLLLHGPPGTGKTEIAKLLPFAMWPGYEAADLKIEVGSRKSGTTVLKLLENALDLMPSGSFDHTVLIDEVEVFKSDFQKEFRGLINHYDKNVFFIFTTNDRESLEPQLISRCREVKIDYALSADRWLNRAKAILDQEGVEATDMDILNIIIAAKCEGRKIMEGLYSYICRVKPPEPLDLAKIQNERPALMTWTD